MAYRKTEQTNQNKQIKQSLDWLKDEKTQWKNTLIKLKFSKAFGEK